MTEVLEHSQSRAVLDNCTSSIHSKWALLLLKSFKCVLICVLNHGTRPSAQARKQTFPTVNSYYLDLTLILAKDKYNNRRSESGLAVRNVLKMIEFAMNLSCNIFFLDVTANFNKSQYRLAITEQSYYKALVSLPDISCIFTFTQLYLLFKHVFDN